MASSSVAASTSAQEENLRVRLRFGMLNNFDDVDPWSKPIPFIFQAGSDRSNRVASIERVLHASISLRRAKEQVRDAILKQAQERCDKVEGGAANYRQPSSEALEGAILQQLADLGQDKELRNAIYKLHDAGSAWQRRRAQRAARSSFSTDSRPSSSSAAEAAGNRNATRSSDNERPSLALPLTSLDTLAAAVGGVQLGAELNDYGGDYDDGNEDDDDDDKDDEDEDDDMKRRRRRWRYRGNRRDPPDPLPSVENVRRQWEKSINEELLAIGQERRQPLLRPRAGLKDGYGSSNGQRTPSPADDADVGPMPSLVSAGASPPLRFLYDSEDLLETIIQIEDESLRDDSEDREEGLDILGGSLWGMIKINLPTLDIQNLQRRFSGMALHLWQLGVDDHPLLPTNAVRAPLSTRDSESSKPGSNGDGNGSCSAGGSSSSKDSKAKTAFRHSTSDGGDNGESVDASDLARRRRFVNPDHPAAQGMDNPKEIQDVINDFAFREMRRGRRVVVESYIPAARHFACSGLPPSLRPNIWRIILGLSPGPYGSGPGGAVHPGEVWEQQEAERAYYAALQQHVERVELLTDELFNMDVHHLADSDHYFPFEDVLFNVMLAFSRDPAIMANSPFSAHRPLHGYAGAAGVPDFCAVPICGVMPFRGLVSYAAALTFMFQDEVPIYFVFRAMYQRYWCKLNVIRSHESTLLSLCQQFEELLQTHDSHLFFHMIQVGVHPLRIALPWIQFAFVPLLDPAEVLVLWDRILGFDDLTVLPILAAAIFVFRSQAAMAMSDAEAVKDLFSDGAELRVAPLLQHFIFPRPVRTAKALATPKLQNSNAASTSSSSSFSASTSTAPSTVAAVAKTEATPDTGSVSAAAAAT